MANETEITVTETPQAAPAAPTTEGTTRQRFVHYGDLQIPIPPNATEQDIRTVMLRTYPELTNATMMELPGGDVKFVMAAGEKG